MERPPAIKKQTSSGGVVFRISEGRAEAALISVRGGKAWCIPKGLIDKNEDPPAAALREVREETGLHGDIIGKLGHISYWYFLNDDRVKVHKTVHFFLLKYVKGSTGDHDHEVDEARWFPIDEAIETLSYKSEKQIMQKAKRMIEELPR
ncbi:MAG: NUDIX hydrolase [Nitrospiraceae bacterium]|nr:MAG: NUDIX hydrolase [Nitrospiraceae bacterium]